MYLCIYVYVYQVMCLPMRYLNISYEKYVIVDTIELK